MSILAYSVQGQMRDLIQASFGEKVQLVDSLPEAEKCIRSSEIEVVIIDLEGWGEEGRKLASYIRGIHRYHLTPIIFMARDSRHEDWAFKKIRCYDYLHEPVSKSQLTEIINLLYSKLDPLYIPKGLVVRMKGEIYRFEIADIVYVEILNKHLVVHTEYDTYEFPYRTMGECVLQGRGELIQCHRAMAVNRRYVERVDVPNRRIYLKDREEYVLLGPKYAWRVKRLFDEKE